MYELKKNGKVFTSKSVGTGPSSCEKKNLEGRGLTKFEKYWYKAQNSEKMERYLQVNLLGPGPRLMKKEFTGPRSHKG
jgi:hypothetical protein